MSERRGNYHSEESHSCDSRFLLWTTACVVLLVLTSPVIAQGDSDLCKRGKYSAVATKGGAILSAAVTLPTPGYTVAFRQRPEAVVPPMFDFTCKPPGEIVIQVLTSYATNVVAIGASAGDKIKVHDVVGEIEVEVVSVGAVCGGIAGVPCPEGQFCRFEDGTCGAVDLQGICQLKPDICTEEFDPVCACNSKTYSNECHAFAAGQSIAKEGGCSAKH